MSKTVRQSKFRHVFGTAAKAKYDSIRITRNNWDSPFCAVNPKFLAVVTEPSDGGSFLVLPLDKVGKLPPDYPQVVGHKGLVMDLAWNPFDDNMIASGSDDTTVKIWQIPDGGLTANLEKAEVTLETHQRKVGHVVWHPTAENILLSASHDNLIIIWNLETTEAVVEIDCHPNLIFSVSWNTDGSKIVTSCKDKKLRIIDARKGEVLCETNGHSGEEPQRAVFCGNMDMIFTTGFSKMSSREYGVWNSANLENLGFEEIDNKSGTLFIDYDPDTKMIYLSGKGDSIIRYFELVLEQPYVYWLSNYSSNIPQSGVCFMPKRGVNVNTVEVAKAFKLVGVANSNFCEPVSFTVPRKSELFQDDLFPDCLSDEPALTADEWLEGKNADPKTRSMRPGSDSKDKASGAGRTTVSKVGQKVKAADSSKEDDQTDVLAMQAAIRKLEETVAAHEKRFKALEEKLGME